MNHYMTPDVVVYIEVLGSGQPRVLLDTVVGIAYEAQGSKIPVFSHKSIEFDAVAEGRSMVSGLLMVNKGYKDMIAAIVASLGSGYVTANQIEAKKIADETDKINGIRDSQSYITPIQDAIGELNAIVDNNPIIPNQSIRRAIAWDLSIWSGIEDDLINAFDTEDPNARLLIPIATKMRKLINELVYPIATTVNTSIEEYQNNIGNSTKLVAKINDENTILISNINTIVNGAKEALIPIKGSMIDSIIDSQLTISKSITKTVTNIPKIYGSDLFNLLRKAGYSVQLILQFGSLNDTAGGNHEVTINDCYFGSEALNVSTDNRDIIKESYSFIARSIT